jgi:hypothetical protein
MGKITVISLFEKHTDPNGVYVNTTSKSETDWQRDLSPFYLGPCELYWGGTAVRMENAWQYSKVYAEHLDVDGNPTKEYFEWAFNGWKNPRAVRYPAGKGRKPAFSFWDDNHYGYIDARKNIYAPLYARAVKKTKGYQKVLELSKSDKNVYLLDFDAYRHEKLGLTLTEVLNKPDKKMGHAFVLMMLLTGDPALNQCKI